MNEQTKAQRVATVREMLLHGLPQETCERLMGGLEQMGFFDAPASTKYHGSYAGGLADHSIAVAHALAELTDRLHLTWQRPASPYLVALLHDLCKCDQYAAKADGSYEWDKHQTLTGHGEKSVILAQQIVELTTEEILCIRWHMGAYEDKSVWDALGNAIAQYPNVLYTHTADMIASRVQGV